MADMCFLSISTNTFNLVIYPYLFIYLFIHSFIHLYIYLFIQFIDLFLGVSLHKDFGAVVLVFH